MIQKALSLLSNLNRNPMDTWAVATNGERLMLCIMGVFLVMDVLRFAFIDMALDVAILFLLYLYIWDDVELHFNLGDDELSDEDNFGAQ